jgi:phosphosulfolactate synthase (CoM biosynthesis protein A)
MPTDKEQLENLMAMIEQSREAQKKYFQYRTGGNLKDAKIKEDSVDNLLKYLKSQGYASVKIVSRDPEQRAMF